MEDPLSHARLTIDWTRSSYCESATCLEVAAVDDQIALRDSKTPDGPKLYLTRKEWGAFLAGARDGDFGSI
jgi:hypothetical protein